MSKEILYRCTNRNGPDGACEYAENGEFLPASKVEKDEEGNPLCPGQTVFGDPCGAVLEPVPPPPPPPPLFLIAVAVVAVFALGFASYKYLTRSAKLRLEITSLTLTPGESASIDLFNDGKGGLKIKQVKFSSDAFSLESAEKLQEVKPGEKRSLRIRLAPEIKDSVQGTLTLDTNGTEKPVNIALSVNVDPWSVYHQLSKNSKILKPE